MTIVLFDFPEQFLVGCERHVSQSGLVADERRLFVWRQNLRIKLIRKVLPPLHLIVCGEGQRSTRLPRPVHSVYAIMPSQVVPRKSSLSASAGRLDARIAPVRVEVGQITVLREMVFGKRLSTLCRQHRDFYCGAPSPAPSASGLKSHFLRSYL